MKKKSGRALCLTAALTLAVTALLAPGTYAPANSPVPVELPDQPPTVALTFDDGPGGSSTVRLLDALALREIPVTFFLVGNRIPGHEDLVRRMGAEGHQVGIHSYSHCRLAGLSPAQLEEEITETRDQLCALLGPGTYWLRPPYGLLDPDQRRCLDCPIALWSVDPEDWKDRDTQRIVHAVLSRVQDGDIILFHDIYDSSVDAALQVADALLDQGFCFATVEELLAQCGTAPENGRIYRRAPLSQNSGQ